MDNTVFLKRRRPFTRDEDAFAPYHQSESFPLTPDEVVSSSLLPEQQHILHQAAAILQISVSDILLTSPIHDKYIIERAAHILNVPLQSLLQLTYQVPESHRQKRPRHSLDSFMPQYTGEGMVGAFQEKAAQPSAYTTNIQAIEASQRQILPLSPTQCSPSFLDSTAAGVAECLGSLAYCPIMSPYDSGTEYQAIPTTGPSHQMGSGAYPINMIPSPIDEGGDTITREYPSSPVGVNWMIGDDPSSGTYVRSFPALQPDVSTTMNTQPTMVQPSTHFEAMYYPDGRQLADFPKSEEAEATIAIESLHVATTNLASYPPAPQTPFQSSIPTDTNSATETSRPHSHSSLPMPAGFPVESRLAAAVTLATSCTEATRSNHRAMATTVPAEGHIPLPHMHISIPPDPALPMQQSAAYQTSVQAHDHVSAAPYIGGIDEKQQNSRPPAARRGPFKDQREREKTAQTRKVGSCIRCRMQRIRCNAKEGDYHSECLGCRKSLGRTWRLPCLRLKISDVELSKTCQVKGHEWTLRWKENSVLADIGNWASAEVRVIRVSEGYTDDSVEFRVRQFIPQKGDKLERSWVTSAGETRSVRIPAYAIVEPDTIVPQYRTYIKKGLITCCNRVLSEHKGKLIWWTYGVAMRLSQMSSALSSQERKAIIDTLELWMTARLTTKSFEIVGKETLGMEHNILDETSPSCGKIPIPPVMGAQLDSVLIEDIQAEIRRTALEGLHKLITENKAKSWLTTYLITFILLHNTALLMKHDASYARKHGMDRRFARPEKVQQYYMGATTLLAYFHYCNKGAFPFSEDMKEDDIRNIANLDEESSGFIHRTRSYVISKKQEWQVLRNSNDYEDDFYFVSQLYEANWQPRNMVI